MASTPPGSPAGDTETSNIQMGRLGRHSSLQIQGQPEAHA